MREFLELAISLAITLVALVMLSPSQVVICLIVIGQSHFLLAYLYQANAGKMTATYCFAYVMTSIMLLGYFVYVPSSSHALLIFTGAIFACHFIADEVYLLNRTLEPFVLFALVPIVTIYTAFIVDKSLHVNIVPVAVVVVLSASAIYLIKRRDFKDVYLVGIGIVFASVVYIPLPVSQDKVVGSIIIYHYMRWYLHFYMRSRKTRWFFSYIRNALAAIMLVTVLFYLYRSYGLIVYVEPIKFVFLPQYFYAWTVLHISSSVNWGRLVKGDCSMYPPSQRKGFSLIEMSIVLIVIGLIAGGVLAGRSLIQASAIRSSIAQFETFNSAMHTFQEKTGYLPGDVTPTVANAIGLSSRTGAAGHGDGNGLLEGCGANSTLAGCETVFFWQDLAALFLIPFTANQSITDTVTPSLSNLEPQNNWRSVVIDFLHSVSPVSNAYALAGTISGTYALGSFFPKSRLGESTYFTVFSLNGINYYQLGGIQAVDDGNYTLQNTLSPEIAYAIDKKIDDGYPFLGNVQAQDDLSSLGVGATPGTTACVYSSGPPYYYNIATASSSSPLCQLELKMN